MWVKHRARLQLGFWGLIWHLEHGRGFGGTPESVGALGEPQGHGVALGWLHRAASSKAGEKEEGKFWHSIWRVRGSVKYGHVSELLEAFWGLLGVR